MGDSDNEMPPVDNTEDPVAAFLAEEENKMSELDLNGEADMNGFAPEAGDNIDNVAVDSAEDEPPLVNGNATPGDIYSAISSVDVQQAEPEKLKQWREEQKEMLEKKDSDEKVDIEKWKQSAAKDLSDWYKKRDEQLEKTKSNNREADAAFSAEMKSTPSSGQHQWGKVSKLVDFNPKVTAKTTKDTSRMRSVLLKLKEQAVAS